MIKLVIADDHPIVREGIKRLIDSCRDMTLLGEVDEGERLLATCRHYEPDVVLLDISMPGANFLELIAQLKRVRRNTNILVLSIHSEEHYAVRSIRAGASGYLNKQHSDQHLETAIRTVAQGRVFVTPGVAAHLAESVQTDAPVSLDPKLLSKREFQVLQGLGMGKSVSDIAGELSLSPKTVSTYKTRLLRKLRLKSHADIITYALRHGIVPQPGPY